MWLRICLLVLVLYTATAWASMPPPILTDEALLLLQPTLDGIPYDAPLTAYQLEGHYFLPLQALAELGGLGLKVNAREGRAAGWMTNTSQTFVLDATKREITLGGRKASFDAGKLWYNEEDIFIEQSLLERWLPLRFSPDARKLTLGIYALSLLPVQQQRARKQQWERLHEPHSPSASSPQPYPLPYQAVSWPFMDFSAGHNYSQTGNGKQGDLSYFMRMGGDMGLLNTQIFAAGGSDKPLDKLRLTAGRRDNEGGLLGPLNATEFLLGDVSSATIPLVASIGEGRGLMVSNHTLNRTSGIDTTRFSGDALPGWDVELYRNGVLMDARPVGATGRYEFANIPVLYGTNRFRLVFYGPQGQRREEIKEIMTSDSILHQGEFSYALSFNERYASMLPLTSDYRPFTFVSTMVNGLEVQEAVPAQEGIRMVGYTEYGLTDHVTMSVGSAHIPLATSTHDYVTSGIRSSVFDRMLLSADVGHDATAGGMVEKTSALTALGGASLKAEHSVYSHFLDEMQEREEKTLRNVSAGEVTLPMPYFSAINTGIIAKRRSFTAGESETSLGHRLSTGYHGVSFTHTLSRVETRSPGIQTITTQGQLGVSGMVKEISLRAAGSYSMPDNKMTAAGISAQKQLKRKLLLVVGATEDMQQSDKTAAFCSLNWDIGQAKFSIKLDANSDQEMFIGSNISFSLAKQPSEGHWQMQSETIAATGGAEMRAFLDANNDGIYNGKDSWISHAGYTMGAKKVAAGNNNTALGVGLPAYVPAAIKLDEGTLEDPLWISAHPGYLVVPRPGVVAPLTFPVIASSEIDGTVWQMTAEGRKPYPRVNVELVDREQKVVQKVQSEFDGAYIFERVVPGHYQLQIAPEVLKQNSLAANSYALDIPGVGDVYEGKDFRVQKQE